MPNRTRRLIGEVLESRFALSVTFMDTGQVIGLASESAKGTCCLGAGLDDLDGDGDIDTFLATAIGYQVWLNDGQGHFVNSDQELESECTGSPVLADLDADGDTDALAVTGSGPPFCLDSWSLDVWINDGDAHFTVRQLNTELAWVVQPGLGDLDKDGDIDALLVSDNFISSGVSVWFNDSSNRFSRGDQPFDRIDGGKAVSIGDIDGDGDLDAFLEGAYSGGHIWINNGNGRFSKTKQELPIEAFREAELGDLDGDGDLDIVDTDGQVLLNDETGQFVETGRLSTERWDKVTLADFDGDRDLDLLLLKHDSHRESERALSIWLNDGLGNFHKDFSLTDSIQGIDVVSVEIGDIDGDHDEDFILLDRRGEGRFWVNVTNEFQPGDSNLDFEFNQDDIVQVLQAAKYLSGERASFENGDWNGDGWFDQLDVVEALQTGNYLHGPYAALAIDVVHAG